MTWLTNALSIVVRILKNKWTWIVLCVCASLFVGLKFLNSDSKIIFLKDAERVTVKIK